MEFEPDALHGHLNEPFEAPGERSLVGIASWLASQY
jgi:hypothetical protein